MHESYRLLRVEFLEDLLRPLLSSVREQHDDLVAVGPRHVRLLDTRRQRLQPRLSVDSGSGKTVCGGGLVCWQMCI